MSTKIPFESRQSAPEAEFERQNLNQALQKLKAAQNSLLLTHRAKQNLEDQRTLLSAKSGVQGKVADAVDHLTMFTKECDVQVEEMQH